MAREYRSTVYSANARRSAPTLVRPAMRFARYGLNEPAVTELQFRQHPVMPGDLPAALWSAAVALELVVIAAVGRGVVVAELFAGGDVARRDEDDVAGEQTVGLARVVDEVGGLGFRGAGQVQTLVDLQAPHLLVCRQELELVTGHASATERGNNLSGRDRFAGDTAVTLAWGSGCPRLWSEETDTHLPKHCGRHRPTSTR